MGKRKCIAKDCDSEPGRLEDQGVSFHRVPKHPEVRKAWYEACRADDNHTSVQMVCSRHFYSADFAKYTGTKFALKKKVIPSIFSWSKPLAESVTSHALLDAKDEDDKDAEMDEEEVNDIEMKVEEEGQEEEEEEASFDSSSDVVDSPPTLEPEDFLPTSGPEDDNIPNLEPSLNLSQLRFVGQLANETSIIKSKIMVEEKWNRSSLVERRSSDQKTADEQNATDFASIIESEPAANSVTFSTEIPADAGEISFQPNARVEALDNNQIWVPATILEVDYEENEVLVRFDSVSSKYEEWISMNSSALRPLMPHGSAERVKQSTEKKIIANTQSKSPRKNVYGVGDRCWAYWTNNRKFLATVTEVQENDNYKVEFDDGYVHTVHVSRMSKPKTSMAKTTKEDRKKRKRKLNVEALFKRRSKTTAKKPLTANEDCTLEGIGDNIASNASHQWFPTFENGVPVGKLAQIQSKQGLKDSYVVPDPRLPENWEKHVYQSEGKHWHCVIVTSDGQKLRYRREYQRYTIANPDFKWQDYTVDFAVYPRRRPPAGPSTLRKEIVNSPGEASADLAIESKSDALKILQVDGGFQCPIEGCGKKFRREHLVQMHVKHYHPEYRKFLESSPNMVDLAYQRLHGDEFESSSPSRQDELKDVDIRKMAYDAPSSSLFAHEFGEDNAPDLKSLAVTTKKGLKTIPALKKCKEEMLETEIDAKRLKLESDVEEETAPISDDYLPTRTITPKMDHYIGEDGKVIKIEQMRKEEIVNCVCTVSEEDGLMIQCEVCMCWQHAVCNNFLREEEVPEKYVCYICQHPRRQRSSKRYMHDQDWLKNGVLPTGSYHARDDEANEKCFKELKTSHDITGGLLEIKEYMYSLKRKIKIAGGKRHPKLYLWSKPWAKPELPEEQKVQNDASEVVVKEEEAVEVKDELKDEDSGLPQPEAPIDIDDCRANLLVHIGHCHKLIEKRLDAFEEQINLLTSSDADDEATDHRIRLTTSMMVRDMAVLKDFSNYGTF